MQKKEKIELVITGIGIIILVFHLFNVFVKSTPEKLPISSELDQVITEEIEPIPIGGIKPDKELEQMPWGRDPFGLKVMLEPKQDVADLVLNGIICDDINPYAMINDEIVKVGDMINGYTVVEITPENVVLEKEGEETILSIWEK